MSVYVDPLCKNGWMLRGRPMPNSHMWADSDEELHAFADKIGLKRSWHQTSNAGLSHYDLTPNRRIVAVRLGAIQMDRADAVSDWKARRRRQNLPNPLPRPADARDEQINYQQRLEQLARHEGNQ